MTKVVLIATLLLTAVVSFAQNPPAISKSKLIQPLTLITVSVNGLSCQTAAGSGTFSVLSWSWGASNSGSLNTGSGAGAGRANVQDLAVTKRFDECSPALFGAVVNGKIYNTVTLTQADTNGITTATVTMTNVLVSSWSVGGSVGDAQPSESVTFNFQKVCLLEVAGGGKVCWDAAQSRTQ